MPKRIKLLGKWVDAEESPAKKPKTKRDIPLERTHGNTVNAIKKHGSEYIDRLGDEEKSYLMDYSVNADTVNDFLRTGKRTDPEIKKAAEVSSSVLGKYSIPHRATVYRGLKNAGHLSRKKTYTDPGMVSTTLEPGVAADFAGPAGTLMKINVPPGSRALHIDSLTNTESKQNEVLLGPGIPMRKLGSGTGTVNGRSYKIKEYDI